MAKTVFDLKNSKKIFFEVSLQFSLLNKPKNIFCFRPLIFWGLAPKERGNIKTWNFGIGVLQQFGTTWHVAKIVFKNHCTLVGIGIKTIDFVIAFCDQKLQFNYCGTVLWKQSHVRVYFFIIVKLIFFGISSLVS